MSVKMVLIIVMRMQPVPILMAATLVPVHLDTLEMESPAMVLNAFFLRQMHYYFTHRYQ